MTPIEMGGIWHLPDFLKAHPDKGLVIYNRVSSWSQAGGDQTTLRAKTEAIVSAIRASAPERRVWVFQGVEGGKLTHPRPIIVDAAKCANENNCGMAACDLARLIRAADYSRTENRYAWPTAEEFERLHELTLRVPLVTVESPFLTEDERHSRATKRTGKAGRPRSIDDVLAAKIFNALGYLYVHWDEKWRWERPIREIADSFGVSPSAIERAADRISPSGLTWRDAAIRKAEAEGLLRVDENGNITILVQAPLSTRGWYERRGRPPKWGIRRPCW